MFSKKQRHQIYKLALEKLENDTHPLIADNIKDATNELCFMDREIFTFKIHLPFPECMFLNSKSMGKQEYISYQKQKKSRIRKLNLMINKTK